MEQIRCLENVVVYLQKYPVLVSSNTCREIIYWTGAIIKVQTLLARLIQEHLLRLLKKTIRISFKNGINIKFKVTYSAYKVSSYTNQKDLTPVNSKFNVIYKFTCLVCNFAHIKKTERSLCQSRALNMIYQKKLMLTAI